MLGIREFITDVLTYDAPKKLICQPPVGQVTILVGRQRHHKHSTTMPVNTSTTRSSVAGSSSQCARCTAMSKRTKEQCGRPALKSSKTQKCQFHGDRGSGPKTPEGRQRVAQAHTVHGRETRQIRQERSQSAYLANL